MNTSNANGMYSILVASERYGRITAWLNACGALLIKLLRFGCRGLILIVEFPSLPIYIKLVWRDETYCGRLARGEIYLEEKNKTVVNQ